MHELVVAGSPDFDEPASVGLREELCVPPLGVHRGRLEIRAEVASEAHLRGGDGETPVAQVVTRGYRARAHRAQEMVHRRAKSECVHRRDGAATSIPETEVLRPAKFRPGVANP